MSDDRIVDSPPAGTSAWREVWESDARFPPRPSGWEWLLRSLRRVFRRATEPDAERQKNFNIALLDALEDIRKEIGKLRDDLKHDLAAVQLDVRDADEALATEVARVRELIPVSAKRNDALIAALDQKIETAAARLRDLTNPVLTTEKQQLTTDFIYRRLEDSLRGPVDVEEYVRRSLDSQPVLDIGCGRGEFLIACKAAGIDAKGFDVNERSVADLQKQGLDVTLSGIPQCFEGIKHGSIGAVLAMHVVEHLPVDHLFALFAQSARVLRPGGLLMIETPNAESIGMTGSDFWRDPTHIAPRHAAALTLLAREHGFTIDEVRAVHPLPEGSEIPYNSSDSESVRQIAEIMNERVLAPQDLRMILKRS